MKALMLILSAAALLTLAASPASAASRKHVRHHHAHDVHGGYQPFTGGSVWSGGPIYQQGFYLGTDPDPNVRFEINRDPYFGRK
jgi:hypothetical protein